MLCPETSIEDAKGVAERIVNMVAEQGTYANQLIAGVSHISEDKRLGCSIGLAEFSPDSECQTSEALLKAADNALYKAKAQGKGQVEF